MEEKFSEIINLIDSLNVLFGSIRSTPRFEYELLDCCLYISGLSSDIALLYNLLWSSTVHYSFCFLSSALDGLLIEVRYIGV